MEHVNEMLVDAVSQLLERRGATSAPVLGVVPIKELMIKMKWDGDIPEIPEMVLDAMEKWPSFARYSY